MKIAVFRAFISQLYRQPRYRDNLDGTATDLWHTEIRELIRGAERDTAAEVREDAAVVAETERPEKVAAAIRKMKFEPE